MFLINQIKAQQFNHIVIKENIGKISSLLTNLGLSEKVEPIMVCLENYIAQNKEEKPLSTIEKRIQVKIKSQRKDEVAFFNDDGLYQLYELQNLFKKNGNDEFLLDGFDYVTDYIEKYPHKKRYKPEILFYTMRDINALKRCRTFISERIPNAVDVDPEKLPYYCYIDCFKRYADVPYWMGNFNIPFIAEEFDEIRDFVVADARFHNQNVFGRVQNVPRGAERAIRNYIARTIRH